jgi:putative ABC transport system substrate-binding protein
MTIDIGRREFISVLGGATFAWPLSAHAQQPALPVIGFLNSLSPPIMAPQLSAFLKGLGEAGYADGQNVLIEFRWADGQDDRLPALAAELVSRQVNVILAGGPPAALAAKAATTRIPIVFTTGDDPVKNGLVSSLSRPGGNATGVSIQLREVQAKRLGLLRQLIPGLTNVGLLVHTGLYSDDVEAAAHDLGLQLYTVNAATEDSLDIAFAALIAHQVGAVFVEADPSFYFWRKRIIALASSASLPSTYEGRPAVVDGGLMGYGASIPDAYRQAGTYVARIIRGEHPGDLPVIQPTNFELVLNLKTAKALGITIPSGVLAIADEVIE